MFIKKLLWFISFFINNFNVILVLSNLLCDPIYIILFNIFVTNTCNATLCLVTLKLVKCFWSIKNTSKVSSLTNSKFSGNLYK